jgi:hypothetical protein
LEVKEKELDHTFGFGIFCDKFASFGEFAIPQFAARFERERHDHLLAYIGLHWAKVGEVLPAQSQRCRQGLVRFE